MRQLIRFIEDDKLPAGHDWMMIQIRDTCYFCIKRSRVSAETLAEGDAAFDELVALSAAQRRSA